MGHKVEPKRFRESAGDKENRPIMIIDKYIRNDSWWTVKQIKCTERTDVHLCC